MKLTIFNAIVRYVTLFFVSLTSMFNSAGIETSLISVNNSNKEKNLDVINSVIEYDTITTYSYNVPTGITHVLTEGQDGVVYLDKDGNTLKTIQKKIDEVLEVGLGKYGEYTGVITGYGPDCYTCDGRGYVACPTNTGKYINLVDDGIYYDDAKFGEVRILAADHREFPCGTIIKITNSDIKEPIIGVVLDTGWGMRNAYNNGYIHIDLAFATEKGLVFNTNSNTSFSVQRWGW